MAFVPLSGDVAHLLQFIVVNVVRKCLHDGEWITCIFDKFSEYREYTAMLL